MQSTTHCPVASPLVSPLAGSVATSNLQCILFKVQSARVNLVASEASTVLKNSSTLNETSFLPGDGTFFGGITGEGGGKSGEEEERQEERPGHRGGRGRRGLTHWIGREGRRRGDSSQTDPHCAHREMRATGGGHVTRAYRTMQMWKSAKIEQMTRTHIPFQRCPRHALWSLSKTLRRDRPSTSPCK